MLAFIAGALLACSFAPISFIPFAYISPAIYAYVCYKHSGKKLVFTSLNYGVGFYLIGVSWIFISIHRYGNSNLLLSGIFTGIFILFLSQFFIVQSLIINKLFANKPNHYLIGFACIWVLFEWLRGWLLTGFPWLFIGYSQTDSLLVHYIPVVGSFGVSFISLIVSVLLLKLTTRFGGKHSRLYVFMWIAIIFSGGYLLGKVTWTIEDNNSVTVSLIQGNITPNDKFMADNPEQMVKDVYLNMSKDINSDFIIWPENSVPIPLQYADNIIEQISNMSKGSNFIIGLPMVLDQNYFYNSLITISGKINHIYNKQKLVPFGEYLPLEKYLRGLVSLFDIPMSSFKPGNNNHSQSFDFPSITFKPLICYEVAYADFARTQMDNSAILTVSEDGWFGDSLGPHQHLQISRVRAIENGRYVVRATSSGISAIIDAKGNLLKTSKQFQPQILSAEIFSYSGATPWSIVGDLPIICILIVLITILALTALVPRLLIK